MGKKNYFFRLQNMQPGVIFISDSSYEARVERYKKVYGYTSVRSNIRRRFDYALVSLCRDKVIEEYLHSKQYSFHKLGVIVNPFRYAPQSAVIMFYSEKPVRVELRVMSAKGNNIYTDDASAKQYHRISVTGLENGKNEIVLSLYDVDGNYLKTRSVYISLRNIDENDTHVVKKELRMQSAYPHIFVTGGSLDPFVMNANGSMFHTIHFLVMRTGLYGVYPFSKERFLWPVRNVSAPSFANPHSALLYDMDFMGRIYKTYHVKKGMHHFVYEMPGGNLVSFSNSMEMYGSYTDAGHMEDMIIEIDRQSGQVVRSVMLKDIFGERFADMVDWVHGNSLEYNEEEDTMLVCMRNIHTVAKIKWSSGELIWFLSVPKMWEGDEISSKLLKPVGNINYSFQAHAAYEIKDFRSKGNDYRFYMVYDNHRLNRRPLNGYTEDKHSYINIYAVDEREMTVRQIKHLQVDMSIVRSNARYDSKSDHIFNMAGCATRDHEDYRGVIEEYEYDTEKLLNRWYIDEDFFSAYPFKWRSDDYCTPLGDIEGSVYECGEAEKLEPIMLVDNNESDSEVNGEEKVVMDKSNEMQTVDSTCFDKPFLEEDYLYFYTKDHSIDSLIFKGEANSYHVDYTVTWQAEKKHADHTYYCVVSYKDIKKERYDIQVRVKGTLYDTGYYIDLTGKE